MRENETREGLLLRAEPTLQIVGDMQSRHVPYLFNVDTQRVGALMAQMQGFDDKTVSKSVIVVGILNLGESLEGLSQRLSGFLPKDSCYAAWMSLDFSEGENDLQTAKQTIAELILTAAVRISFAEKMVRNNKGYRLWRASNWATYGGLAVGATSFAAGFVMREDIPLLGGAIAALASAIASRKTGREMSAIVEANSRDDARIKHTIRGVMVDREFRNWMDAVYVAPNPHYVPLW